MILALGLIGMVLILAAYFLSTLYMISRFQWHVLNATGSSILCCYAYLTNTVPFLILNIVWVLVALYGIYDLTKRPVKS
jgi:hypothetical protein